MANPSLLFWDADALIQVLLTSIYPIKILRSDYGIQSVVVPEVELEVLAPRRITPAGAALKKARGNGLIRVLDEPTYRQLLGESESLRAEAAGTSYADIQIRGNEYNRRVDTGEAYAFAAALTLHQPAVSHDMNAISTLLGAHLPVPFVVLRAFDLVVFAHQIGKMSEQDCDRFRKTLVQLDEWIPSPQRDKSFRDGLARFEPRLIDSTRAIVGVPPAAGGPGRFFSPLYVEPLQRPQGQVGC